MIWYISNKSEELVGHVVYGMLGELYNTHSAFKEYKKNFKLLVIRYQQVHDRLLKYINNVSERSKVNSLELDRIRCKLLKTEKEKLYEHSEMMQNWEICYDYYTIFKNIIEESNAIEQEISECINMIEKTIKEFHGYKGVNRIVYASILSSWAGLGGFAATGNLFRKKGVFAFSGALLGTCIIRLMNRWTSSERNIIHNSLGRMKIDLENLSHERKEFELFITPMVSDVKNYENIAFEICNPQNLPASKELYCQTMKMWKETDMLQVYFQKTQVQANQTLRNIEYTSIITDIIYHYPQ